MFLFHGPLRGEMLVQTKWKILLPLPKGLLSFGSTSNGLAVTKYGPWNPTALESSTSSVQCKAPETHSPTSTDK